MDALVSDLMQQVELGSAEPWALFGHSMGALLGHAFIHKRQSLGLSLPVSFFASGAASPVARVRQRISLLPGELFWEKIASYGLIPEAIFKDQGFRDYFEVLLRNDFAAVEGYIPAPGLFNIPLHVLYGQDDMSAPQAESWRDVGCGEVQSYPFSGGHFFLFDHLDEVCQIIQGVINRAVGEYCQAT
jgi:medium-chain acyl-[acyl-carrier-protein] hydrolase